MKKRFSQHLLTDKNCLNKIINSIDLKSSDVVVEIGAGSGNLTKLLSERVKKVYAVEIERDILVKLKENLISNKCSNVEVVEKDFLKLDLNKFGPFRVVGNIPYNITSNILLKLFGEIDSPAPHLKHLQDVYLMLQFEVANRVVANPHTKAYSPLTILVQFFSCPKILFKVPSIAFSPKPKVDSAFVEFKIRNNLMKVSDPSLLKRIIRVGFQQRRKKIVNSLGTLIQGKSELEKILQCLKIKQNLRPEDLSIHDFINIADYVYAKPSGLIP